MFLSLSHSLLTNLMFSFSLISNLNSQQERVPLYLCKRVPCYCQQRRAAGKFSLEWSAANASNPTEKVLWYKRGAKACKLITLSVPQKRPSEKARGMFWVQWCVAYKIVWLRKTPVDCFCPAGFLFCCVAALCSQSMCMKKTSAGRMRCCDLFHMEINAAECSQLPNKWLWLSVVHSKAAKNRGALAVAWEQKGGINKERNKASVWVELKNAPHSWVLCEEP